MAKKMLELGDDVVIIIDRNDAPGPWHSGAYEHASIISSRRTAELPDHPVPDTYTATPAVTSQSPRPASMARPISACGPGPTSFPSCSSVFPRPNRAGGYRSVAKADTRSYGAVEADRSVEHLNNILDDIGCPDTPAEHRLRHVPCPPESKEPLS
ncbi:hypothetical protein ACSDR0_44740 [Streptosporangium sp. G11]|uniref:hypothetical protein n=1 Tax=Streptosporangium sp. G11 TaxID=3436926 RepID=UPI003EBADEA3